MDKESLESVLHRLEMDDELDNFKKQSIELQTLEEMSESELVDALKEMNINIGKRQILLKEIIQIKSRKYNKNTIYNVMHCLNMSRLFINRGSFFLQKMNLATVEQSMSLNVSKYPIKGL